MLDRFIDGVEAAVASIVADMRAQCDAQVRELKTELELFHARSTAAEVQYRLFERQMMDDIHARLAELTDGEDCDMDAVNRRLDEAIAAMPVPKDADPVDMAEVERLVGEYVAGAVAALPPAEPGRDADPEEIRRAIDEAVAALPPPEPGKNADPAEVERLVAEHVERAVAALPPAEPGRDADPAEVERLVAEHIERAIAMLPPAERGQDADPEVMRAQVADAVTVAVGAIPAAPAGKDADEDAIVARVLAGMPSQEELRGPPGRLPVAEPWVDRVYYDGDVVIWRGATWQAQRHTGKEPSHDDWICLASAGEDGRSPAVRELYDPNVNYSELDIVSLKGGSFIARLDNPGPCPGDGWQLLASQGKRGSIDPAEVRAMVASEVKRSVAALPIAPKPADLNLDDTGLLVLSLGDGTQLEADFAEVLRR